MQDKIRSLNRMFLIKNYFRRIAEAGICHHFALVTGDISGEIEKAAEILNIKLGYLFRLFRIVRILKFI